MTKYEQRAQIRAHYAQEMAKINAQADAAIAAIDAWGEKVRLQHEAAIAEQKRLMKEIYAQLGIEWKD